MICAACGATASQDARFCASCGRPFRVADDERRVVTVLFADLVGFTTLSERLDPERVKNLVDRCFDRLAIDVTEFGGQVDKIVGDAIVALFGAPTAHEDDAERAVRAALRMQQTLREEAESIGAALQIRVGVNTGEVLVGSMRAAGTITAMGDVVNTASRLQTAARPGEVLVGPATHAATHRTIGYEARGLLAAKGRDEPVATWVATAPTLPPGYRARRVDGPLVGRDHEVGLLRHAVDTSIRHQRALLVLLVGDVGMGKSRLADEVAAWSVGQHRAVVREGRCVPYGEANVWWPVADALRDGLHVREGDALDVARHSVLEQVAGAMRRRPSDAEVARTAEGLLTLLGYDPPAGADPTSVRQEAGRALGAYAAASSEHRPLVLQISDLHWADEAVLSLIDDVFGAIHHRPVVVLASARPALLERWTPRPGRHNALVLHLDPLDREAAGDLLEQLVGTPVPDDVAEALLDRSGGNPFFLEELVSLLDGDGVEPGGAAVGRMAKLPDTLRGLVAARLDDLAPALRSVLQDAAVIGQQGPLAGLREMGLQLDRGVDFDAAMATLVADEVLEVSGGVWSFRSDLVREVAYQTITKGDRAKAHLGIATFIEQGAARQDPRPPWVVDQLAHHYAAAVALAAELGPVGRTASFPPDLADQARRWVVEAAERSRRDQALPTASRLYGQALDLLGPTGPEVAPDRVAAAISLHLARASVHAESWDLAAARLHLEAASELADRLGDLGAVADALVVRGDVEQKEGDIDAAVLTLSAAAEQYRELGDQRGTGRALRQRGMAEIFGNRVAEAEASAAAALEAFEQAGDRAGQGWASQNLAWTAFVTGRTAEADRRAQTAIDFFSEPLDTRGLAWSLGLLSWVRFQQHRVPEAAAMAEQVLEEARARNDPWATAMMTLLLASVRLWAGRTDAAVELADVSLRAFQSIGDRYGTGVAGAVLGRAMVMAGRVDEGFTLLGRIGDPEYGRDLGRDLGRDHDREPGPTRVPGRERDRDLARVVGRERDRDLGRDLGRGPAGGQMGRFTRLAAALQVGEPDRGADVAAELDVIEGIGGDDPSVALGLLALQQGDVASAIAHLEAVSVDEADTNGLAVLALLAAARGSGGAAALAEAVRGAPAPTYLDRALAEIGAALEAVNRQDPRSDGPSTARRHLAVAAEAVAATDDRVAAAIVATAAAAVAARLGDPDADDLARRRDALLDRLGIEAHGWFRVFALATGAVPA